jgi:hypothetical protein
MVRLGGSDGCGVFWGTSVLLGGLCWSGSALAQTTSDPATARVLFAEGRKLMADKHYEQACPKFEESLRLDSGIGAMFNLADCWEHSGRTASAWSMFLDAASAARAANQSDRMKVAKERAAKLEPKLARMTIRSGAAEPGLEVRRDGQLVGTAAFDTAVPIDPGAHHIDVTASGKKPFSTTVEVGAAASVSVQIPKLEDAEVSAAPVGAAAGGAPNAVATAPSAAPSDAGAGAGHSRVLPYALAGVGVVGLGIGTAFMVMSRGKNSDALNICPANAACTQPDIDRHDGLVRDAKSEQLVAIVGAGVGAASLIAAGVLLLTDKPSASAQSARAWRLDFTAGAQGGGLFAKGSF